MSLQRASKQNVSAVLKHRDYNDKKDSELKRLIGSSFTINEGTHGGSGSQYKHEKLLSCIACGSFTALISKQSNQMYPSSVHLTLQWFQLSRHDTTTLCVSIVCCTKYVLCLLGYFNNKYTTTCDRGYMLDWWTRTNDSMNPG